MHILFEILLVYIFFVLLIIGILFSKVKINIIHLEVESQMKKTNKKYAINLGLYIYGKIKIFGITFEENGIKFLWKRIKYSKFKNAKICEYLKKVNIKEVEKDFKLKELKGLKPELEKLDLNLDLGFESVLLTSFMIFAISTLLSLVVKDSVKKYNPTKYRYKIIPHYRSQNTISLKLNCIIAIKSVHIMLILLNYRRRRVKKYERPSYRRSYENSYE